MRLIVSMMMVAMLLPILSQAEETPPAGLIAQMQGVYKYRFSNSLVSGERYQSEDIIEIVAVDDAHIYVRAELDFANGHSCSIWGVAGYEAGSFVYRESEKLLENGPLCTLRIAQRKDKLMLTDVDAGVSSCRMYCGARGSLSGYTIPSAARRKIRYMQKLKASTQYQESLNAFKASSGH